MLNHMFFFFFLFPYPYDLFIHIFVHTQGDEVGYTLEKLLFFSSKILPTPGQIPLYGSESSHHDHKPFIDIYSIQSYFVFCIEERGNKSENLLFRELNHRFMSFQ